ncbi:protein SDA1 homolog [Zophobas morio]|uniref:protein SDA1 homolog n=1 Tax=Zophobas morio TaxID=2755281 RepID=UPI003083B61F
MTVGINTIRAICQRAPLGMTDALLQDLTQYKKYRDKGVSIAAKTLINTFRELNPAMLHKKDRGKEASLNIDRRTVFQYGEVHASSFVPGTELLADGDLATSEDASGFDPPEDSSDGDWIDLADSAEGAESVVDAVVTPDIERAEKISSTWILSSADFAVIKRKRMQEKCSGALRKRPREHPIIVSNNNEKLTDQIISKTAIETFYKKKKMSKEERIQSVNDGRIGRAKFGSKKNKMRTGGLSNAKKKNTKNFLMMLKSKKVRSKKFAAKSQKKKLRRPTKKKPKK